MVQCMHAYISMVVMVHASIGSKGPAFHTVLPPRDACSPANIYLMTRGWIDQFQGGLSLQCIHYICKQIALKGSFKCKILFTFSRRCLEIGDTKKLCVFNLGQQLIWSSIYSVASINQSINQSNCLGTPPHPNARWIWSDRSCRIRDPQGKVPGRMEVLCLQSDATGHDDVA